MSNHVRTDRQVCETRLCAAACRAARRLSALTLAALATGYYPMAQLQNRVFRGGG